jgi:hypothetical protein
MGQEYNPKQIPDPRTWADCSCGKFRAHGRDLKDVMSLLNLHAKINKDTHYVGGVNSYFLHVPEKPRWYHKFFRGIKSKHNNP